MEPTYDESKTHILLPLLVLAFTLTWNVLEWSKPFDLRRERERRKERNHFIQGLKL